MYFAKAVTIAQPGYKIIRINRVNLIIINEEEKLA